ncbi:S26 family signal peptidase [Ilumatobacter sp.]|uniref:S26 family signal peptidase n=1 Tax=Ilumatobacter sp. TaxID=1967498 RepID=UPI003B51EE39
MSRVGRSLLRRLRSGRVGIRRFLVADRSMEPTLVAGQGLVAVRSRRARVGQIRCVEDPRRPGFWLVKRVESVDVTSTTMRVRSDNDEVASVDSRRFGEVPVAGSYRVVVAIPIRWM